MKILSFINPIKFGGGERLMLDFGEYFKKEGIEFKMVNLNRSVEFEEKLTEGGVPFLDIGDFRFGQTPRKSEYFLLLVRLLTSIPALRALIKTEHPDYVVANGFPSNALVVAALSFSRNKPKMIYVHHFMKAKEGALAGFIYEIILRKYDRIIAVSSHVQDTLIEVFPRLKEKITFVTNGIDSGRFRVVESKESLRKRFNLPTGVLAINVARLAAFKNQNVLVGLASEITEGDAHIVIAGEGDEYKNLSQAIERGKVQNKVALLGKIDSGDMPSYLNAADIFLFPSLKEGFSIAVMEAMAAGLPVVILKNIYAEELGTDLFVAKDIDEFKDMAKRLIGDQTLRRTMGDKARQYIMDHLDISITGKKFLEAIR